MNRENECSNACIWVEEKLIRNTIQTHDTHVLLVQLQNGSIEMMFCVFVTDWWKTKFHTKKKKKTQRQNENKEHFRHSLSDLRVARIFYSPYRFSIFFFCVILVFFLFGFFFCAVLGCVWRSTLLWIGWKWIECVCLFIEIILEVTMKIDEKLCVSVAGVVWMIN